MRTEMNKKENLKASIIECCINGTMTIKVAADRLGFSERYVKKLKARYKKLGASSMLHGNCGRQPKHTINAETKSKIIEIWEQPEYEECNFKHLIETSGYLDLVKYYQKKGKKVSIVDFRELTSNVIDGGVYINTINKWK